MERGELINKIDEINNILPQEPNNWSSLECHSFYITTTQFVRNYIGKDTEFYLALDEYSKNEYKDVSNEKAWLAKKVLRALKDYLKLNLDIQRTEKYNVKIDIISDFMLQAVELASKNEFHPAAAGILMGAALEEFLRKLAEEKEIDLEGVKPTIDPISKKLYESQIISKQDLKDITSWTGIRNDATHGNFEAVNDRRRIKNAIEGANLFMRKYTD